MSQKHLRHIQGSGSFVGDIDGENTAVMVVLRSPVAHGVILDLDVAQALEMQGVLDVLIKDELDEMGVGFLKTTAQVESSDGAPMYDPDRPILADGKLVYLGQPVAAVIAESLDVANDALERITLEIEDLEPVLDPTLAQDCAPISEGSARNRSFTWKKGAEAETDAAFAKADHVVGLEIKHPRVSVAPMETRGCIGSYEDGRYTLTTGSQGVMGIKRDLVEILGVDEAEVRVITPDVGGSFAVKIWTYPEHVLALVAARRLSKRRNCHRFSHQCDCRYGGVFESRGALCGNGRCCASLWAML